MERYVQHILPDLLQSNLSVIFCGTAAGTFSAEEGEYYAHSNNFFWSILHETGLTPIKFKPREFRRLLEYGIGLTDLVKDAHGNDGSVRRADDNDRQALRAKVEENQPAFLAFTSKNAGAQFYKVSAISLGEQPPINATRVFVLPSTSLSARWQWKDTSAHWHDFAREVAPRAAAP